ncbi:MAG: hypothetical protein A3J97_06405 [Spirochaetes bacterium RIFOXYC1_FULL_54_7]|nr:MAG: hypothetical protein A3J97_06405 [Spirochaetes bacterium RIFOXYC1_FULL_54_7]
MHMETSWLVFPDGDRQETQRSLRLAELVDMNGNPLPMPPPSPRMIAYRVFRIRKIEERGSSDSLHYLELVPASELVDLIRFS